VAWGANGSGKAAADRFFAELDPEVATEHPESKPLEIQQEPPELRA
jgi:hypothetical protein